MEVPSSDVIRFGPYEIRPSTREFFSHGVRVKLPPQAFEVLRVLLERKGELITRQEFQRVLWPADTFVDFDQGLNNAIKKIREVLNDSVQAPRYIETLPRLGYRFVGTLEFPQQNAVGPSGNGENSAAAEPTEKLKVGETLTVETHVVAAVRPRRFSRWVLGGLAAIVLLALAWVFRPSYPPPRIVGVVQLTADGIPKWGFLATDGLRVYFTENLNGHETIAAVPVSGGQSVPLKLPFEQVGLYGISPDRTDLLVAETSDMLQEAPLWRAPIIGGTPRRLGNITAHDASWSPDGAKLAYVNGGSLYLANADGSNSRTLLASRNVPDEWAWRPTWSPDGRRLRFEYYVMPRNGGWLFEVNADGTNLHALFSASPDLPFQAFGDWTPDGRYYIFTSWKDLDSGIPFPAANLWVRREKSDLLHRASTTPVDLTTGPIRYFVHATGLDGKTIFTLSSLKHGELMRYHSRTKSFSLYASGLSAEGVSFSPDGAWMAYVKYPQGELWRSRADGSEALQLSSRPLFAATPAWSPDNKQIVFAGLRAGEAWRSYLVSADGGPPRLIDEIGKGLDPTWSPDGNSLVFDDQAQSDNMIGILNLQTKAISPVPGSRGLLSPRMSPDGRWMLALSNDAQKLLLFDRQTQSWRELVGAKSIAWPQWSGDSKQVYFSRVDAEPAIMRVGLNGSTPEQVVSLKSLHTTGVQDGWFSLAPAGDVLVLHDTGGGTEIYALSWDAP